MPKMNANTQPSARIPSETGTAATGPKIQFLLDKYAQV